MYCFNCCISCRHVIIEYALKSNASQFVHSGKVSFPLARAFMDDINLMSVSIPEAQDLLSKWTEARSLLGMSFRAGKFHIVGIIKGKLMNSALFDVSEPSSHIDFSCYIPSIHLKPGRFLGRIIDASCQTENQSIFLFRSSSWLIWFRKYLFHHWKKKEVALHIEVAEYSSTYYWH